MRRICVFLGVLLLLAAPAWAQDFELPGLQADSDAYANTLTSHFPAGGNAPARVKAEQQADAASRKRDWAATAAALETRIGLGQASAQQWLALAQAQIRRAPPETARALQAAWQAFDQTTQGPDQIPALLIMTDALRLMGRPGQAVQALEAVVQRAPDNAQFKQLLADARRATGMLVRRVEPEPEADPPRACITFTVAPARRGDLNPQDWVKLDPARPGAAVTREGDQFCVSGLPSGMTTRVTVRAGLPGEDGINLLKDTVLSVAMADRRPRIVFDSRLFLLPRGQAPKLTMTTINLSAVKLSLVKLTERNVIAFAKSHAFGESLSADSADDIASDSGSVVWQGSADVPKWERNKAARTALPLPDALGDPNTMGGPGLYLLVARAGDGTPDRYGDIAATQLIQRTDLAPTVWRGTDGLTVQVRAYSDVKPRAGVRVDLVAVNNDVLARATTDGDGVARFAAPLLHGQAGLAPRQIHLFGPGEDFAALDLESASFDLSDRGVAGMEDPGPLDAFVWLDRGIYRPGETVQVMALLRDGAGKPADFPAHVKILRPNGQVFLDATPPRGGDASVYLPVALSAGAASGMWTVEIHADPDAPPVGRAEFRVDAFVPDRMAVDVGPATAPIVPGTKYDVPVAARFLYGAPAAGLTGSATINLVFDPAAVSALAGYAIGLDGETYAPEALQQDLPDTDAQGHTTLSLNLPRAPDTTHPLKAEIAVSINDPSGHAARGSIDIPVRPAGNLIGLRALFAGGAVDRGAEAGFDIAAVNADGARIPLKAKLRLVRERPDWRLVLSGGLAHFETVWRDEPLETADVAIPADAPLHWSKALDFGRYRLELTEAGGMAATSVRFRAGWAASESPDVPDNVDVSADRASYAPGATARIHIAPPFAGEATLVVAGGRVHSLRTLTVAEGGTDVDVPVSADWGPGAYVAVHVFRPAPDPATSRPGRAIGLVWVGVDPAARKLDVAVQVPDKYPPRSHQDVPVRTAPGAWVTLAAVDEGILRLTQFHSPDPAAHFLGRRGLGIDIRDDWGRLIAPGEGEATALRQGGDDGASALPEIPQKTVTLFTPPVKAGADGIAHVALDLPDFAGQVRLMAVSWLANRVGAAEADVLVRDPLVAEPLLPRFLAPGDETRLSVLLQNLELPGGEAAADVSVEGPLQVTGPTHLAATLAPGAQSVPNTVLRATGAGRGVIRLDVTGPGGFHVQRETGIIIRPARGALTAVIAGEIAPGAEATLTPPADLYVPGTWRAVASFGGEVRYDPAALVRALETFPLMCLEQAASKGFPLAVLPDGPVAGDQRAARLLASVASVLDRQRFDGGFGLWSASGEAEPWLSSYATEFLIRAKAAGAPVPEQALKDALKFAADAADGTFDKPGELADQAYRLYVLALAGQGMPGAARVLAEQMEALPTPLSRAQLGAALLAAHDRPRAEGAFVFALNTMTRRSWSEDYGTALRDQVAVAMLLRESGLLPDRLQRLLASLPGSDLNPDALSTQEQAWAAAAAAVLGRDGHPVRVALNGTALPVGPIAAAALAGPGTARNLGDQKIGTSLAMTGVLRDAPPASRSQMRVTRKFLNLDGGPLDLDHLRQNTVFVLLLEGRAEDGQAHNAMLLHGLPAGWEIAGRFAAGDVTGAAWLGQLSDTLSQPAADDRFAAVMALTPDAASFRVAVRLRAVTPGTYELPGADVSDMYRPGVYARQATGRVTVLPLE